MGFVEAGLDAVNFRGALASASPSTASYHMQMREINLELNGIRGDFSGLAQKLR